MKSEMMNSPPFMAAVDRLVDLSINGYYNPYKEFEWPNELPAHTKWMSDGLLSVYGTELEGSLSEEQLVQLGKWESINFYSLNVHGIRELMHEVISRIHVHGYEVASRFFHHFIGEENEHMWFFATFCIKYGGKIYPSLQLKSDGMDSDPEITDFLAFAKITIFEEIVDHYNTIMSKDDEILPIIRKINHIHHIDESRHIAFGRKVLAALFERIRETKTDETLHRIETYLRRYMEFSIKTFYSPDVYRDVGIPNPLGFRAQLLSHPARIAQNLRVLKRSADFLQSIGALGKGEAILQ